MIDQNNFSIGACTLVPKIMRPSCACDVIVDKVHILKSLIDCCMRFYVTCVFFFMYLFIVFFSCFFFLSDRVLLVLYSFFLCSSHYNINFSC